MAMRKAIMAVAIVGGALALAACASQPATKGSQKTAQNQENGKIKFCVSGTPLGSHIVQTHCVLMTKAQYKNYKKVQKERAQKDRDMWNDAQQNGSTNPNKITPPGGV